VAIPDYQTLMRPLLEACSDGKEHRIRELIDALAARFGLTSDERMQILPSGTDTTFGNRVGWARTYLKKAGLLEQPARGMVTITPNGAEVLKSGARIDNAYLAQFEGFRAFRDRSAAISPAPTESKVYVATTTPEEALQEAFDELRNGLINEVHEALLRSSPAFFERAVVDLLLAMGYGG
jgi:restriction system protein